MPEDKSDSDVHEAAKVLGSEGGKKGGPARAKKLTAKEKSDIARLGGLAKAAKEKARGKTKKTAKSTKKKELKAKLKKKRKAKEPPQ